MLSDFTVIANAIGATTKKNEKERLLADYLSGLDDASLERAVVFFSGSPFSRRSERVAGIGGAAISDAVSEVTGRSADEVWASWSKYGDAGDTVAENFPNDPSRTITLSELAEYFERIAATQGAIEKRNALVDLFRKVDAQGARYIVKILTGELRIGLQEGLVESAIAKAFGQSPCSPPGEHVHWRHRCHRAAREKRCARERQDGAVSSVRIHARAAGGGSSRNRRRARHRRIR